MVGDILLLLLRVECNPLLLVSVCVYVPVSRLFFLFFVLLLSCVADRPRGCDIVGWEKARVAWNRAVIGCRCTDRCFDYRWLGVSAISAI